MKSADHLKGWTSYQHMSIDFSPSEVNTVEKLSKAGLSAFTG